MSLIQKFQYLKIKLLGQLYLSLLHRKDKEERMEIETIASGQDGKSGCEKKKRNQKFCIRIAKWEKIKSRRLASYDAKLIEGLGRIW